MAYTIVSFIEERERDLVSILGKKRILGVDLFILDIALLLFFID